MTDPNKKTDNVLMFSPELRGCLERLDKLELDAEEFGRYMGADPAKQREAWRIIDGGRS